MNFVPDWFRRQSSVFTEQVILAACADAVQSYPLESCGIVQSGKYVKCQNVAENPSETFEITALSIGKAIKSGDFEGVIHSHPNGPFWPSKADMQSQIETKVPWAILASKEDGAELVCHWGEQRPPVFINGEHVSRAFLHGVSDCYSLCQDYFAEIFNVKLGEFPREWEWWKAPQSAGGLYLDNLEAQGFEVVSTSPQEYASIAKTGDAYLMAVHSKVPNHAGIYLGDGLLLEHMHGNLSHSEPIARKLKHISHWLRLKGSNA